MLIIFDFYLFVIFENRRLFCSLLAIADRKTNNGTGDDGVGNDDTAHWKRMNIQQTNDHWGGDATWSWSHVCVIDVGLDGARRKKRVTQRNERIWKQKRMSVPGSWTTGQRVCLVNCWQNVIHTCIEMHAIVGRERSSGYEREADRMIGPISKTTPSHNRNGFPSIPFFFYSFDNNR